MNITRQFRPLRTWRFWVAWPIVLAIALRVVFLLRQDDRPRDLAEGHYVVSFVIDGDTLTLVDAKRIRLIGVDTPETHKREQPPERWGPEAGAFTRAFVARGGGVVRLQFDDERLDKYGRYLAYVWVDGKLLNEELIRHGLGRFTPGFRFSETFKRRLRAAEREAKSRRAGIWSD